MLILKIALIHVYWRCTVYACLLGELYEWTVLRGLDIKGKVSDVHTLKLGKMKFTRKKKGFQRKKEHRPTPKR